MFVTAFIFTILKPGLPLSLHLRVAVEIMKGPFASYPSFGAAWGNVSGVLWLSATILLFCSHPLLPRRWTLVMTFCGGFFWWFMGFGAIIAGA